MSLKTWTISINSRSKQHFCFKFEISAHSPTTITWVALLFTSFPPIQILVHCTMTTSDHTASNSGTLHHDNFWPHCFQFWYIAPWQLLTTLLPIHYTLLISLLHHTSFPPIQILVHCTMTTSDHTASNSLHTINLPPTPLSIHYSLITKLFGPI